MSEDEQRQHLHLIDTSESLTLDELREWWSISNSKQPQHFEWQSDFPQLSMR